MHHGEVIGERFELAQLAAGGGIGAIYRALDRTTGRPVAIKILRGPRGSSARFERETRILSQIDHPLVVGYVAHGALPSGDAYLAMEWLDGEDLATRLARGPLSPADSVTLAIATAEALGVLHDRGIVHRHLKPSNIFLMQGRVDQIKLLDFRLARIEAATRVTKTGELLGTVAYMAPEQARGMAEVGAPADVFALGCVLFECLTGTRAFSAANTVGSLAKILFQEAPRLSDVLPEAPPALEAVLARMMVKRPEDRPSHGRAAAEALRHASLSPAEPGGEQKGPSVLTAGEQQTVAIILLDTTGDDYADPEAGGTELEHEVAEHGGSIERLFEGSVAVLLSRVPVATDLAVQAARCTLAMAGIAPGRRIAVAIGRSENLQRLAVGPAADRAAHLLRGQGSAQDEPPQAVIALDDITVGLLDARFDVREEGGVFVLRGERELSDGRTLLGKLTPCVGRERDLQLLEDLFDECVAEGVAHAVVISGPAGAGKSRIGREFLRHVRSREPQAAVWIGRGDSLRAGSAFGILGQVLRSACGVRESEPLDLRREKIRACVAECVADSEQKRVAEFLGEITGAYFPSDDSLTLRAARKDPRLMNDQMRVAFIDFVAAQCARHPVVILLEDLHWGDWLTERFIDRALCELRAQPLFVLALARLSIHEMFPRLWADRTSQHVYLKGLHRKAIDRLVRHVLGDATSSDTIERIARLSEGNAFFVEELIRWTAGGQNSGLPETVVSMVQSRLSALDEPSRRLLRAASVFGEVFCPGGVGALLGDMGQDPYLRNRLSLLVDQEFLTKRRDSRFPGEEEYAFRHALVREGAYAMLTEHDLALGHRLAGLWLEGHGEQDAVLLAEHFEKGGDAERAGRHYRRAAEQANAGGDSTAAVALVRRGLAGGVSPELRIALLGTLCEAQFFQLDLVGTVHAEARELLAVARHGSAPWIQAMIIVLVCAQQGDRPDEVWAALRSLLAVEPSEDTADALSLALAIEVFLLTSAGRIQDAGAAVDRLAAIAHLVGDCESLPQLYWHGLPAILMASTSEDPAGGLLHTEAMLGIAAAIGHRRYAEIARAYAGTNRWFLGAFAEAEHALKEVTVAEEEMGYVSSVRPFSLAWLLADRGALGEAREWAMRLVASGQVRRLAVDEGRGRWVLAEVLRRAGELDEAEAAIQSALALLREASPLDHPGALATLAALRIAQERPAEALAAAEEGLAKYTAMGACSLFFRGAFLRLVHAECLKAGGNHDAASVAIAKAKERLFAIADKVTDPQYRRSFLENVPENVRTLELARQWTAGE